MKVRVKRPEGLALGGAVLFRCRYAWLAMLFFEIELDW